MDEHKEKNNKKINLTLLIIACIIISTIFTFNLSNSRYIAEAQADKDALAIPVLTLSNNGLTHTIENMLPGDTREITFSVSNTEGTKTSEILLDYYFKINMQSAIPLQVKIYDITSGSEVDVTSNNASNPLTMPKTDATTKNYKLKVIWNAADNDASYAGQQITCNVALEAVQVVS